MKFLGKNNQKRPDQPLLILYVQLKDVKIGGQKMFFLSYLPNLSKF